MVRLLIIINRGGILEQKLMIRRCDVKKGKRDWKFEIERIIETKNAIIQLVFFTLLLAISGLSIWEIQKKETIIIELLSIISMEIVVLNIKDSIVHRKLNGLNVKIDEENGQILRVSDFDLNDFFKKTKTEFFISGIALNYFFTKFNKEIIELLQNKKTLYVIIEDPDIIPECTKLYHGKQK